MRKFLAVLAALGSCLVVLLVPSTAWSATVPADTTLPSWVQITNWVLGTNSLTFRFLDTRTPSPGINQKQIGTSACSGGGDTTTSWGTFVSQSSNTIGADFTVTCPAGQTFVSGASLVGILMKDNGLVRIGAGTYSPPVTHPTCTSFRHVTPTWAAGSLDVTWGWTGDPGRGWTLTDAKTSDAVGAGTQLLQVPGTALVSGGASYGFREFVIPAAILSLRVQSKANPSCFFSLAVTRDASGNVTGVGVSQTDPPDTSPPDQGNDGSGASCGTFDLGCWLKYLFIPKPSSWGFEALKTQAQSRPPVSIMVTMGTTLAGVVDAYTNAGCANMPLMPIPGINYQSPWQHINGQGQSCPETANNTDGALLARALLSLFIYVTTALIAWSMMRGAFSDGD